MNKRKRFLINFSFLTILNSIIWVLVFAVGCRSPRMITHQTLNFEKIEKGNLALHNDTVIVLRAKTGHLISPAHGINLIGDRFVFKNNLDTICYDSIDRNKVRISDTSIFRFSMIKTKVILRFDDYSYVAFKLDNRLRYNDTLNIAFCLEITDQTYIVDCCRIYFELSKTGNIIHPFFHKRHFVDTYCIPLQYNHETFEKDDKRYILYQKNFIVPRYAKNSRWLIVRTTCRFNLLPSDYYWELKQTINKQKTE